MNSDDEFDDKYSDRDKYKNFRYNQHRFPRDLECRGKHLTADKNIRDIYEFFVGPLIREKPNDWDESTWIEYLWGTHDRPITIYIVKSPFDPPGALLKVPMHPTMAGDRRQAKKGDMAFIRVEKDCYHLEVIGVSLGQEVSSMYKLSYEQYMEVRRSLCLPSSR